MNSDPKQAAGRAFVRSLNILLKFARLYGHDHSRTGEQLSIAWTELRTAIPEGSESSLLLGATANQLLLDGVPLEGSPAEKQFALLLSSAGLASVQFFPSVTQEEIAKFARAFPNGKAKPSELAQQLKAAMEGVRGIRTNEVCFVATDSRVKDATSMAAQLAAVSIGDDKDQFKQLLNNPQKLLELIAAAEGTKGAGQGSPGTGIGTGTGSGGSGTGSGSGSGSAYSGAPASTVDYFASGTEVVPPTGMPATIGPGVSAGYGGAGNGGALLSTPASSSSSSTTGVNSQILSGVAAASGISGSTARQGTLLRMGEVSEEEILSILGALSSFGNFSAGQGGMAAAAAFQSQVAEMPGRAQDTLRNALASIAAQAPNAKPDESVLVQLAEHLAIRFALERYEKGEVKVNAVRQMLERMNSEIENLRKILGAHEEKMAEAGILAQTHKEILDRQFWAAVPESNKRAVLLSAEAWCIPARNVQSFVAELFKRGDGAEAMSILSNYASCADGEDADARKRTAAGLSELAELYAKADPRLLSQALRHLGIRLSVEQDAELQALVSAAFVRLSQEAASNRCFAAMEQALDLLAGVESQRPGIVRELRSKMGFEQRVPEFVEEALKARQLAAGLTNVLRMLPQQAMEHLASRFNRCQLREEAEHVANLAQDLGEEVVQFLRSAVRGGTITETVEMVGLLCRLDPQAVEVFLPARVKNFPRAAQDRTIRQISASGAPSRCGLLIK